MNAQGERERGGVRTRGCVFVEEEKIRSALGRNKQHSHAVAVLLPAHPFSNVRSVTVEMATLSHVEGRHDTERSYFQGRQVPLRYEKSVEGESMDLSDHISFPHPQISSSSKWLMKYCPVAVLFVTFEI